MELYVYGLHASIDELEIELDWRLAQYDPFEGLDEYEYPEGIVYDDLGY